MKKIISLLLAFCISAVATGCSGGENSGSTAVQTDSSESLNNSAVSADRYQLNGRAEQNESDSDVKTDITAELGEAVSATGSRVTVSIGVSTQPPASANDSPSTPHTSQSTSVHSSIALEKLEISGYVPKYYQLTMNQRAAYDDIINGIVANKREIVLTSRISRNDLYKVYDALLTTADIELYCPTRAYKLSYNESTDYVYSITPEYSYTSAQIAAMQKELKHCTDEILGKITPNMTQVEKLKVLHDEIIKRCEYNIEVTRSTDNSHVSKVIEQTNGDSAYGALVSGKAVCEGYARALMYLCKRTDIPCELVSGWAGNEPHMWNMVCVDGNWYNIDVTWDDPVVSEGTLTVDGNMSYAYFNLTDNEISRDHMVNSAMFDVPKATATDANYYVHYGLIASDTEQAVDIITKSIIKEMENGSNVVSVKFNSIETMNTALAFIFENNGISEILQSVNEQTNAEIKRSSILRSVDKTHNILKMSFSVSVPTAN